MIQIDIEMPKNCKECPFLCDNDACYAVNKPNAMFIPLVCNGSTDEYPLNEFPYWEKRVDWCPLQEVKHGKWVEFVDDRWGATYYSCSECGKPPLIEERTNRWCLSNFCPNCGVRMEK